ncbi:hypothetical protein OS493_014615 [Desmophyllum pertusum]|uniref:Uncharacterized protein n=1 Tax=Desmophyllum pertusum TaxID=174260 RepID=A0A9W9YPT4_9CNID|nr:hypothetical protein OS493_014615 [Desmophyllum pertusum]
MAQKWLSDFFPSVSKQTRNEDQGEAVEQQELDQKNRQEVEKDKQEVEKDKQAQTLEVPEVEGMLERSLESDPAVKRAMTKEIEINQAAEMDLLSVTKAIFTHQEHLIAKNADIKSTNVDIKTPLHNRVKR